MSTKNHRKNVAAESRLLDHSPLEQRALQISRDEGRDTPSAEDRARAREELLAPNETASTAPEVAPELGEEITVWDDAPESYGHKVEDRIPDDKETSIGQDLIENGLRGPSRTKTDKDLLRRQDS